MTSRLHDFNPRHRLEFMAASHYQSIVYSAVPPRHGAKTCQNGIVSKPPVSNRKPFVVNRKH